MTDRRARTRRHATGGAGGQPQTGTGRPAAVSRLPAEQARAYLAAIVESSVDAIKAQTLDGTVVFWNQATERMYGYTAEEAIGRKILFVIPLERHHEMAEILERVGRGERVERVETERIRKDGTRLDVSISVSPIRDEQGNVVGAATIARDVTEQRRAERGQRLLAAASRLFAEARLDTQAILDGLCRIVVEEMADNAVVEMLAEDGVWLRPAAVHAVAPEHAELRRRLLIQHPVCVGEGLGGQIVRSGQPIVVPVVEPDELRAKLVPGHRPHLTQLGVRSLLGVPLRAHGHTVGALLLSRHTAGRPYAEGDLAIVQELADRAAMALDVARVHAEERRARLSAEHLAAITREIERSLALDEVLDRVAGAAAELLGSPVAGVFLLSRDGEAFDLVASRGLDLGQAARISLPRRTSGAGRATAIGRTIVVNDVAREPNVVLPRLVGGGNIGSLVIAPMGAPHAPVGVIEVYAQAPGAFDERDAELLTALADAAAVAVANARLHHDVQEQAAGHVRLNAELREIAEARDAARAAAERALARTQFVARASAELSASLDYEATLATVARLAVPGFADWCAVDVVDDDGKIRRLAVAHVDPTKVALAQEIAQRYPTPPDAPTGVPRVIGTGEPELYPDLPDELLADLAVDDEQLRLIRALGLRSAIIVPMAARGRVLGALSLVWAESERRYDEGDLAVAEDLGRRAAVAVDNARLYRAARAARDEAEAQRDRLRQVVGEMPEGVLVVDAEGHVVVANPEAARIIGSDPQDRWLPSGAETTRGVRRADGTPLPVEELPIARALRRGETIHGEPILVRHATEDRDLSLLVSATPLRNAAGAVDGAVAVFRDVTAIRDLERERDALLAAAAHDLKNPIGIVKGSAQLLLRSLRRTGTVPAERLEPVLTTIEATATRMGALVDELLDATRLRLGQRLALDRRPTDLVGLARALTGAFQGATDAHRIHLNAAVPTLVGDWDEARIGRVLGNLLSNAVKFSEGGDVRVDVAREDGWAVVRVSDEGVGIPVDELERVFARFRRGSNAAGVAGTGIGLAGAREIVEQHGGTIGVESALGEGATFTVRLPLQSTNEQPSQLTGGPA